MKKLIIPIILTILLSFMVSSFAAPAPFEKAKEIALKAKINDQGNYIAEIICNENGEEILFIFGYLPTSGYIGVGSNIDGIIYEYNEKTQILTVWTRMGRLSVEDKNKKLFFERVFQIFRYLVKHKLI